jgi:hypothetical protein
MLKTVSGYNQKQFAALENFEDNADINKSMGATIENIKIPPNESIGHCESKHNTLFFNKVCS